jgi:hypothetical protein
VRDVNTRLLVVGGISGVAIPLGGLSAQVPVDWNHYLVESFMLFAQSGAVADTAQLSVSMFDARTGETLFSSDDGDPFQPALALVGRNPSLIFSGGPRWFRMRRRVTPEDRWLMQVKGPVGMVPIFGLLVTRVAPTEGLAA